MAKSKTKQYIYITQALLEPSKCKIGKTNDLDRRLKEYNNMTGKSKENIYQYLFTCEVKDMSALENDIKIKFSTLREEKSKEIYFFNAPLFKNYVEYIKLHKMFVKEIFIKTDENKEIVKIIKKTAPSLKERSLSKRDVMQRAKRVDNDEFYTRLEDIEIELSMYDNKIWKNKVIFCNCDDAVDNDVNNTSAFALFFLQKFQTFELKKLICTHFGGVVDLFNQGAKGYIFTKDGYKEFKDYPKGYDGSFDHPISIKILKEEADIVCTNPPFSRSIDYWDLLIKSGKKFIIISNEVVTISTAYIPYFMDNKVWAGHNEIKWFLTPKKELTRAPSYWFTNITIKNRSNYGNLKIMPLKDIPENYKKYDDTNTLLVNNSYIPNDYKKPIAVSTRPIINGILEKGFKIINDKEYTPYISGKKCFKRVLIQKI